MRKQKKHDDNQIIVRTESQKDFFLRGQRRAKLLDEGVVPATERIISFESAEDLVKFLSID